MPLGEAELAECRGAPAQSSAVLYLSVCVLAWGNPIGRMVFQMATRGWILSGLVRAGGCGQPGSRRKVISWGSDSQQTTGLTPHLVAALELRETTLHGVPTCLLSRDDASGSRVGAGAGGVGPGRARRGGQGAPNPTPRPPLLRRQPRGAGSALLPQQGECPGPAALRPTFDLGGRPHTSRVFCVPLSVFRSHVTCQPHLLK